MKRIAILLAAVGLGSGCVVSSPCDRTLNVDWLFVSAGGTPDLSCAAAGIDSVDVYIDGARVAYAEPCTSYGLSFLGYSEDAHEIMVEGFSGSTIINRDWDTIPSGCGDATFNASPGSGYVDIQPTACGAGTYYLMYHLSDVTFGYPGTLISSNIPSDPAYFYTCTAGINFPVPYGYYDLEQIEAINSTDTVTYGSKCTGTAADVLTWGNNTTSVVFTGTSTCTW